MNKVAHFEIPADDTDRANKFYTEVFGWNSVPMPEMKYTMFHTGPTDEKGMVQEKAFINGGMFARGDSGFTGPIFTMEVENIDKALEKIKANGGSTFKDKIEVGDMGYAAYFKDTEGNVLGLWENK